MDSLSMGSANNNSSRNDVSSFSDDEVSISVAQKLAKEAGLLFQLGKYVDCLKVLNQLLLKKADNPMILHNIAIAENFRDGFSNPKRYLEALDNLKKRSERLAHLSRKTAEVVSDGSKCVENKGTDSVPNQVSVINGSRGISVDDFDDSLIMFNMAVTLYHLYEYEKCFSILEQLYQNIEPIDERISRRICLLLLDVALVYNRASTAAGVINYLERVGANSLGSQGDAQSFTQQPQSTNLVTKSTSAPNNMILSDSINTESTVNSNGHESPLSQTLSEETLYESLISSLDIGGVQKITRSSNDHPKTQMNESFLTMPDLRLKMHLYKIWVLIVTRNLKAAKREVKMAMNVARGKDHTMALFLKSHLEFAKGNYRKARKLLMVLNNQTEMGNSTIYYNNLGCIYYQLGKYQTSAVFFLKALGISSALRMERPVKLLSFSNDKSILFVYNCGLVYLASGKPVLAARCFQKAGSVLFKRPLLWLRMAECCIMASEKKSNIKINVIGKGKWRQLVIESGNSGKMMQMEPNLSLKFARTCLLNALYLLEFSHASKLDFASKLAPTVSNGEVKESKMDSSLQSSIDDYEGICGKEKHMILQAVLADLAFVYLEMGNAVKALVAASRLLILPECSRIYNFLGDLYSAEAYCHMNRPKQASDHLSGYISGKNMECGMWQMRKPMDNDNNTPSPDGSLFQNCPLFVKPEEARGTLLANIAAVAAVQGDIKRAHEAAELALSAIPNSPELLLTATYIDLVCGNSQEAITKLKKCSRVKFLTATIPAY